MCGNKFAFLIVDPPPDVVDVGSAVAWKATRSASRRRTPGRGSRTSGWTTRSNRARSCRTRRRARSPASSRAPTPRVGVWQAPAGTDATVAGAYGPAAELSDEEQGLLNPIAVNVIRQLPDLPDRGVRLPHGRRRERAGERVEVHPGAPDRQLHPAVAVGVAALGGAQAQRRGPVGPAAGQLSRRSCRGCSGRARSRARRRGRRTSSPATRRRLPQDDIDQGVVNIVIGFSPLKPAEFVVISLRQIVQPAA